MKLRKTSFFLAMARIAASASSSVCAPGRASPSPDLMLAGTMAAVIDSSESWPMAWSMCAISASLGPMWRSMKASWCSRSRRLGLDMAEGTWVRGRGTARVQGAGGRLRWCPSVLLPESLEPRGLAAWFVPLRRRFRQCRAVSPECWSRAVVSGLSDYGRLRLRQRGRGPRFSHRSGVDYTRRPLRPGSARGIGAWLVNLVRPPEPSRSPRESCRLFPVPARRGAPRPPRRARPVRRTPWPRHRRGSRGAGRRAMSARIPGQRTLALLLAGLAMFGPFSIDMIFPAFPAMGVDLGADKLAMQQTISIYLVAYALMSLVHGPLSDLLGRRRVILTGLVVFAFASAGCAL